MMISTDSVSAVVLDRGDAPTAATLEAVALQSSAPAQLIVAASPRRVPQVRNRFGSEAVVVADSSPLPAAVRRARDAAAKWIWLLDGRMVPARDALAALLETAAAWPDQRLCLLSSTLVARDGTLLTAEAPLPQALDPDLAVEAFERHACSLRVVGYGSLLVRAEALGASMPPSADLGADLVWSARLLANGVGLLVPRSIAVGAGANSARARLRLLAGWSRLLLSDALATRDKPWVAYIYLERGVALIADWARGRRPSAAHPISPAK